MTTPDDVCEGCGQPIHPCLPCEEAAALRAPAEEQWRCDDDHPIEVWRGEKKVTIYPDSVLRSWGSNIDTEMSDEPINLSTIQRAMDWLYESPSAAPKDKPEWEVRKDGKRVRTDRWEVGFRNVVSMLVGARAEFEIDEIVEMLRSRLAAPAEPTDETLRAMWKSMAGTDLAIEQSLLDGMRRAYYVAHGINAPQTEQQR